MLLKHFYTFLSKSKRLKIVLILNLFIAILIGLYTRPNQMYSSQILLKIYRPTSGGAATLSILSGTSQGLTPEAAAYRATNKKALYRLLNTEYDYFNLGFNKYPTSVHDSILEVFFRNQLDYEINNSSNEVKINVRYTDEDSLNLFMTTFTQFISDSVVNKEINALKFQLQYLNNEQSLIQNDIINLTRDLYKLGDESNSLKLQADFAPFKLLEKKIKIKETQLNVLSEQIIMKNTEIELYNQEIFFDDIFNYTTQKIEYSLIKTIIEYLFYFSLITILIFSILFLTNDKS